MLMASFNPSIEHRDGENKRSHSGVIQMCVEEGYYAIGVRPTGLPRFQSRGGGGNRGGGGGDMRQQGSNLMGSSRNLRAERKTERTVMKNCSSDRRATCFPYVVTLSRTIILQHRLAHTWLDILPECAERMLSM